MDYSDLEDELSDLLERHDEFYNDNDAPLINLNGVLDRIRYVSRLMGEMKRYEKNPTSWGR